MLLYFVLGFLSYINAQDAGYHTFISKDIDRLEIVGKPTPQLGIKKLNALPKYIDKGRDGLPLTNVDLRSKDISSLDFLNRFNDLIHSDFNSKTKWPKKMPKNFDPKSIIKLGMDPGLGVRGLHKKGITGKGVSIAIIDQSLLVDHVEYKNNLKMYEEIHWSENESEMHGPAVASIAVGKNSGVAPDADLYFIATKPGFYDPNGNYEYDLTYLAKAIDRIIKINKALPRDKKIKIVSISLGIGNWFNKYEKALEAIERAKKAGIYVLHVADQHGIEGLKRNPLKDPNKYSSYKKIFPGPHVMFPMDSRAVASPTGDSDYVFYNQGGVSWVVPYVAGLYALGLQVNPNMTPELFWEKINSTARKVEGVGKIADPVKFIEAVKPIPKH